MKICFYNVKSYEKEYLIKSNLNNHEIHFVSEKLSLNNIFRAQNCNAISIFSSDTCDKSFIEKFNKMGIQLILLRSAGYDNVDLSTAQKYKIKVARVPDYSPEAIAEHIITLILAISRNIYAGQLRVSQLNFSLVGLMGFNLSDKTVGVIGTGKIGSSLIKILKGFGSKILAHDLIENKTFKNDASVQYVTKTELLQKSDIVSLNLPLNEHTFHYIDFEEIEMMQNQSILINTSRGAILNTQALLKGIDSGKISRAGIDVYENEKEYFFKDNSEKGITDTVLKKLIECPKILLTGHQAYFTNTAISNIAALTFKNIDDFEKNISTPSFLP